MSKRKSMRTSIQPWYREPWPWILSVGPVAVILAGAVTAWLAIKSNDGLVVDDYYKQGLEVNQVIERDRRADALGLRATVLQGQGGNFRVLLTASGNAPLPPRLKLRFLHPARGGLDREVILDADGLGAYSGRSNDGGLGGRWLVRLEDEAGSWRLSADWAMDKLESLPMGSDEGQSAKR